MRRAALLLAIALLVALSTAATRSIDTEDEAPPVPAALYSSDSADPVWLGAEALLSEDGAPNAELIGALSNSDSVKWILSQADQNRGPCVRYGPIYSDPPPPPPGQPPSYYLPARSLQEFADRKTQAVLLGSVVGSEGGFFWGMPGLLLQIEIEERLKPSEKFWNERYLYFYYPVGDFAFGSIRVCKTDDRWPPPPSIGARVLLFPTYPAPDQDGVVVETQTDGPFEIVFEQDRQVFGGPRNWITEEQRVGDGALEALAHRVRVGLATSQEEGER